MKIAVGHSTDPWAAEAIQEIIEQCQEQLGDEVPQAGVLFACIDSKHEKLLKGLYAVWPSLELIGCTTDGELSSREEFQEDSVVLMLFASDKARFKACVGRNMSQGIGQAVSQVTQGLDADAKLCIALPESLTVSGASVVDSLQEALGSDVVLVGGTASDQWAFKATYQFFNGEVLSDSLPMLCISGELNVSVGVSSGWKSLGGQGLVTRSEGGTVFEIDDKPALDFYRQYFGEFHLENLQAYPLGVTVQEDGEERFFLRTPLNLEQDKGIIHFAADVPEGSLVYLTEAGRGEILNACEESIKLALADFPNTKPAAALAISCAVRKQVLGTKTCEEYRKLAHAISPDLPVIGFYSYGEIAPLKDQAPAHFHNETFVTILIGD